MSIIKNILRLDKKCLRKFIWNFGWKGLRGFSKFQKRKKKGSLFPAFQFISVTNDCNLNCQGCWVSRADTASRLDIDTVNHIINESKKEGSYFFGILGGEPLMYKPLMEIFKSHPDCYFQLFTNGTLLTDQLASELRKLGNVTPLISFEGNETVADIRRGSKDVYNRTIKAVETAVRNKLVSGVAISVCKSNIEMALSEEFVRMLHDKGIIYLWYYIYRPSGENPCYDLALSTEEIERLRNFLVDGRTKYPMVLIDSYWRADGEPFCPAAEGLSHHINSSGYIEPCPVIQFSKDLINGGNLKEIYENSTFLKDFRQKINEKTNGCILMEDPEWLNKLAEDNQAINTSNRKDFMEQLAHAKCIASHGSCKKIPEKHWAYKMGKKRAFFGLGAYG
jgi:MoaA/NifB/PqqE/SkfB family radical SAM enzyme